MTMTFKDQSMKYTIKIDAEKAKVRFLSWKDREIYSYDIMRSEKGLVIPLGVLIMIETMAEQGFELAGIDYPISDPVHLLN